MPLSKLYFAYGSNMNPTQMLFRCPNSEAVAIAKISGYRFAINSRGVSTIVSCENDAVLGILWKISPKDEARLDCFEGVKLKVYKKQTMTVELENKGKKKALVYIASDSSYGIPRKGYLEKIIDGARFFGIDGKYISKLKRLSYE